MQPICYFGNVVARDGWNFQHDAIWLNQFKVAARQTFVGAVDEHDFVVNQRSVIRMRQHVK